MPIDQSPLDLQQWGSNHARGHKPAAGYHAHGVPLPPDTALTVGLTRPFKVSDAQRMDNRRGSRRGSPSLQPRAVVPVLVTLDAPRVLAHPWRLLPPQVTAIPPNMRVGGKGPLLSAYKYDRDMLWARVSQIHQLSLEVRTGQQQQTREWTGE